MKNKILRAITWIAGGWTAFWIGDIAIYNPKSILILAPALIWLWIFILANADRPLFPDIFPGK